MAETPESISHAFSLSGGHLAWAIGAAKKHIENRKFRISPGWYAYGVTLNAHTGVMDDKFYKEKYGDEYPGFSAFDGMRGKIMGVCYISHSLPHQACENDDHASAAYAIKNIISKVIPLVSGVPARGNLGTWPIGIEARDEVRRQLGNLLSGGDDVILHTNAEKKYPPDSGWTAKTPVESLGGAREKPVKAKTTANVKPVPKISKRSLSQAAKPKKKAPLTDAELDYKHSMDDMKLCARLMPESHGHEAVRTGILAFFQKAPTNL